ncbi:MAG TPA: hypothetical protein DIS79_04985 [Bacteroidetes bacterium]|nr:hypothetical protein [Bacteroidota bacterium]HRK05029.1 FlgD immunoglobulin-like domain containing protein [Chlorobiota bacterium]
MLSRLFTIALILILASAAALSQMTGASLTMSSLQLALRHHGPLHIQGIGVVQLGSTARGGIEASGNSQSRPATMNVAPNPANTFTVLTFDIPTPEPRITVDISDANGLIVRTLTADNVASGTSTIRWDLRDNAGTLVNSGTYYATASTPNFTLTQKIVVQR